VLVVGWDTAPSQPEAGNHPINPMYVDLVRLMANGLEWSHVKFGLSTWLVQNSPYGGGS
jgi:hypothetical protein